MLESYFGVEIKISILLYFDVSDRVCKKEKNILKMVTCKGDRVKKISFVSNIEI